MLGAAQRRRQRRVRAPALAVRRRFEQRGTHQRVAKHDPAADHAEQASPLGGVERILGQPRLAGRAHHRSHLAAVVHRRDQQRGPRLGGQTVDALHEGRPEPGRQGGGLGQRGAALQLRLGQATRQLEQGERVSGRLGKQPLAHGIGRLGRARRQELGGRLGARGPPPRARASPAPRTRRPAPSRAANTIATGSAASLRALKTSASADATSRNCASSIRHRSGPSSAAAASRLSAAAETSKRSEPGDGASPSAPASAAACVSGSSPSLSTIGRSSPYRPAKARSDSASTPVVRSTLGHSPPRSAAYSVAPSCRSRPHRAARGSCSRRAQKPPAGGRSRRTPAHGRPTRRSRVSPSVHRRARESGRTDRRSRLARSPMRSNARALILVASHRTTSHSQMKVKR